MNGQGTKNGVTPETRKAIQQAIGFTDQQMADAERRAAASEQLDNNYNLSDGAKAFAKSLVFLDQTVTFPKP